MAQPDLISSGQLDSAAKLRAHWHVPPPRLPVSAQVRTRRRAGHLASAIEASETFDFSIVQPEVAPRDYVWTSMGLYNITSINDDRTTRVVRPTAERGVQVIATSCSIAAAPECDRRVPLRPEPIRLQLSAFRTVRSEPIAPADRTNHNRHRRGTDLRYRQRRHRGAQRAKPSRGPQ